MRDETILAIVAVLCLTILEVAALIHHINSALFGLVVAAISGIAGYEFRGWKEKR